MGLSGDGDKFSLIGAIAGMSGMICNVLCAKRNISNYFFGLLNVTLYAWIAWQNRIYGDVALNLIYYLPMQFVGFFTWYKRRDVESEEDKSAVKVKRLSRKQRIKLLVLMGIIIFVTGFILKRYTSDPQPFKDSATTIISIVAMLLMVATFVEQWWLWIAVNIISTVMWIYAYQSGGEGSGEMIIKWFFNLANSINGYIVWSKAVKKQTETPYSTLRQV